MEETEPHGTDAKTDKMAATKPSHFLSMLRSALDRNLNRNQEKPSTQAISEHAQWESQSLGIKAASNDALPLTPNQTSPCTHRSCHFWNSFAFASLLSSQL